MGSDTPRILAGGDVERKQQRRGRGKWERGRKQVGGRKSQKTAPTRDDNERR